MEAKAIVMMIVGIILLYGGLAYCIGIALRHAKSTTKKDS